MNTKTLSTRSSAVIDQYSYFKIGNAVCSVPYFNNKTTRQRATLRANGGKGSPKDIFEEVESVLLKAHVALDSLTDESLKKLLTDSNLGIDCSAFAYYVLNAENEEHDKGGLDKHISFVNCHGLLGKMRCSLRPVENCDVSTLANDKNSHVIQLTEMAPGDIITMIFGEIRRLSNILNRIWRKKSSATGTMAMETRRLAMKRKMNATTSWSSIKSSTKILCPTKSTTLTQ